MLRLIRGFFLHGRRRRLVVRPVNGLALHEKDQYASSLPVGRSRSALAQMLLTLQLHFG